ncbi:unnamed protein product [Orchesella dallaii]|uniref:C2H2-type domain-containing protein n=1 Tax=Orchesella dallaii TaxID=48710 RepID=A0ABP1QK19_9HEXA
MESSSVPSTSRVVSTNTSVNMTSVLGDGSSIVNSQVTTSSSSSKEANDRVTNKVMCLICCKDVPQHFDAEIMEEGEMKQLRKLLKNIYFLLRETSKIPKVCTNEMFPFCFDCKNIMGNLMCKYEADQHNKKKVLDGLEDLRRQWIKGQLRELEISRLPASREIIFTQAEEKKYWDFKWLVNKGMRLRYSRLTNQNADPIDNESPSNQIDTELVSTEGVQIIEPFQNFNPNAQAGGEMATQIEPDMSPDSDDLNDNISSNQIRMQVVAFHGVNMIKCFATNKEFLKCIACFHTETIQNSSKDDEAPYTKLKIHTQSSHNVEPGKTPETTADDTSLSRQEVPLSSSKQKEKKRNLTRRTPRILECDICLRPVQGGQLNLQRHQFSHNNRAEKLAAIAAEEKGAYRNNLIKKSEKRKMEDVVGSEYPPKIFTRTANGVLFQCTICISTFKTENFLELHMETEHAAWTDESTDDE